MFCSNMFLGGEEVYAGVFKIKTRGVYLYIFTKNCTNIAKKVYRERRVKRVLNSDIVLLILSFILSASMNLSRITSRQRLH